ncbi:MAG: hypothetical protein PHI06_01750 [Desulfobulbaceae bacterium]|nr:hypothetical protein [Desulfobulbaceae bacterium]
MAESKTHWMLCTGKDFASTREKVYSFFTKSILLSYDNISVIESASCSAENARFWEELEEGVAANKLVLRGFLDELRAEGCQEIDDLKKLPLGFPSKVLHLIAHLLDGFIGIDSVFYNLIEDSHWLSDKLRDAILREPDGYWLLRVEASFLSVEAASFLHITENKA